MVQCFVVLREHTWIVVASFAHLVTTRLGASPGENKVVS